MNKKTLVLLIFTLLICGIFLIRFINRIYTSVGPGTNIEKFCGTSAYSNCVADNDCKVGGCSGQICGASGEDLISTCEYRECYNAQKYNYECKCVDQKCQWS